MNKEKIKTNVFFHPEYQMQNVVEDGPSVNFIQKFILVIESGRLDVRSRCCFSQTCREFYKHQINDQAYQQLTIEPRLLTLAKQLPEDPKWQFNYIRSIGSFGNRRTKQMTEEIGFLVGRRRCIGYALMHSLPWTCIDRMVILVRLVISVCNFVEGRDFNETHLGWDGSAARGITQDFRSWVADTLFKVSARIVVGILNSGEEQAHYIPSLLLDDQKWNDFYEFWSELPSLEII